MLPFHLLLANLLIFKLFISYLSDKYDKPPRVYFLIGGFSCSFPFIYLRYEISAYLLRHHFDLYFATSHYYDWALWILISFNFIIFYQLLRIIWKREKLKKEYLNIDEIGKPSGLI